MTNSDSDVISIASSSSTPSSLSPQEEAEAMVESNRYDFSAMARKKRSFKERVAERYRVGSDKVAQKISAFKEMTPEQKKIHAIGVSMSIADGIKEGVKNINAFLSDYKVVVALVCIRGFVKAETKAMKLTHLLALVELYTSGDTTAIVDSIAGCVEHIQSLFEMIVRIVDTPTEENLTVVCDDFTAAQQQAGGTASFECLTDQVELDLGTGDLVYKHNGPRAVKSTLSVGESENETETSSTTTTLTPVRGTVGSTVRQIGTNLNNNAVDILQKYSKVLRPAIGILALMAASMGFTKALEFDWIKASNKSLAQLASHIKNKNVVAGAVEEATDTVLGVMYEMAGQTYIPPKAQALHCMNERVKALEREVNKTNEALQLDVFGARQAMSAGDLEKAFEALNNEYYKIEKSERSLYNLQPALQRIKTNIDLVFQRKKAIIGMSGKQEPVRVWIYGAPGVGKTRIANMIRDYMGLAEYPRDMTDKYWSNYCGQFICRYDDIGQREPYTDIMEWHSHASENTTLVSAAGIADKGMLFSSQILMATSNTLDMIQSSVITDIASFNRRRDIVIYGYNPGVEAEHARKGQDPDEAWYAAHPTRYLLLKGSPGKQEGIKPPDDKDVFKHERFICELDLPGICEIIKNTVLLRREKRRIALSKQTGIHKYITVPKEKIYYDRFYTDFDLLRTHYVESMKMMGTLSANERKAPIVNSLWKATRDPNELFFSLTSLTWTSDSDIGDDDDPDEFAERLLDQDVEQPKPPAPESYEFEPAKTQTISHGVPLVLMGPPGTGKTHELKEWCKGRDNVLYLTPTDFDAKPTGDLVTDERVVVIEDFSLTTRMVEKFSLVMDAYYDGTSKNAFIMASCNPTLIKDQARLELIKRRCVCVNYKGTWKYKVLCGRKALMNQKAPELWELLMEARKDKVAPAARAAEWMTVSNIGKETSFDNKLDAVSVGAYIDQVYKKHMEVHTAIVQSELVLPMPDKYDFLVESTLTVEEIEKFSSITDIFRVSHKIQIYDGQHRPKSITALWDYVSLAYNLLKQQYVEDRAHVTRVFNSRGMKLDKNVTIVLETPDYTYGWIQTPGDNCLMFQVEEGTQPAMSLLSREKCIIGGVEYTDPASAPARAAMAALFNINLEPVEKLLPSKTQDETTFDLVKASPMGQALMSILDLVALGLRGFAIGTLFASLGASKPAKQESEVQPEATPGVPVSSRQTQRRNDDAQPAVQVSLPKEPRPVKPEKAKPKHLRIGSGYEGANKFPCLVLKHEGVIRDWTMMVHVDGTFGVMFADSILCARKKSEGVYETKYLPLSNEWAVVDLKQYNGNYQTPSHGNYTVELEKTKHHDAIAVKKMIGQLLEVSNRGHNLSSVFAFSYGTGWPIDVHSKKVLPSAAVDMFTRVEFAPPAALKERLRSTFDKSYQVLNSREVQSEAMLDSQCRDQTKQIMMNTVTFALNGEHHVHGVMLRDRVGITVAHVATQAKLYDQQGRELTWRGKFFDEHYDICVFEVTDKMREAWPSIMHHVVRTEDLSRIWTDNNNYVPITLNIPPPYGAERKSDTIMHCEMKPNCTTSSMLAGSAAVYAAFLRQYAMETGVSKPGDCGAPVMIVNPRVNHKWCGIHRAGSHVSSVGCVITFEWLNQLLTSPTVVAQPESAQVANAIVSLPEITLNSELVKDEETGLLVAGTLAQPIHLPTQTRLQRTPFLVEGYDDCEPAALSKNDPRVDGEDLYIKGLTNYGKDTGGVLDLAEINDAMLEIGNECANKFIVQRQGVEVFSKTEAINRPSYNRYPMAKPLDRSGSTGFPHILHGKYMKKGDFLEFNEKHEQWYFKDDKEAQRISSKIDQLIFDAANDVIHVNPFVAYCKDEVVKLAKIYDVSRKTRIFFSGTTEYLIAYRMYFGAAMQRIMENHATLPPKIGMAANMCDDWNTLAYRLAAKSEDHCFATDLKNYDSSISSAFIKAVNHVYDEIYRRCSNPDADVMRNQTIRHNLHRSVESAYVIARDKVFKLNQAMVSGCPGTAIENSFVIWALYYIVWRRLAFKHAPAYADYRSFRDIVELAIYGDDNVASVRPGFAWFNFNSFREEAAKMGFTVTDALKTGGPVPDYVNITKLDFLQRGFTKLGSFWLGPLSKRSIGKPLHYIHDGKAYSITDEKVPLVKGKRQFPVSQNRQLLKEALNAQWSEIAKLGKEEYERIRDILMKQAQTAGIEAEAPTWRDAMAACGYQVSSSYSSD